MADYTAALESVTYEQTNNLVAAPPRTITFSVEDGLGISSVAAMRIVDLPGPAAGTEFQVNTYTPNGQFRPEVASDAAGDYVVVWESFGEDGNPNPNDYGVYVSSTIRVAWPRGASSRSIRSRAANKGGRRWPWIRPAISSSPGKMLTS